MCRVLVGPGTGPEVLQPNVAAFSLNRLPSRTYLRRTVIDLWPFVWAIKCAIRLKPDTEYGRIRTRNTDESGHPIRGKADT